MGCSVWPAFSAMALFIGLIYIISVFLMQVITTKYPRGDAPDDLSVWFSSLSTTVLTMFECFTGGLDWQLVSTALRSNIHPLMGLLFCIFVSMGIFVSINL